MKYNTTIASLVVSNESNSTEPKEVFEADLDYDEIITVAYPTIVYAKGSNLFAWYEVLANVGYKPQ